MLIVAPRSNLFFIRIETSDGEQVYIISSYGGLAEEAGLISKFYTPRTPPKWKTDKLAPTLFKQI